MLFNLLLENSMSKAWIRVLTLTALLSAGSANAFVIDGDLSDWGLLRTGRSEEHTSELQSH